jgi:zinc transporter ZupT
MANFYSSLVTIPGALFVYYFIPTGAEDKIAVLLAIAAGIFLYLGASDFLPEIGEHDSRSKTFKKVFFVLLGVTLMYSLSFILPGS